MKLRGRITYANVMSTIAVFGVLAGGTAIAAKKITSKQIAAKAIGTKQLKALAVTEAKLADGSFTAAKVGNLITRGNSTPLPDGSTQSLSVGCASGERLISGGAGFLGSRGADTPILESKPGLPGGFGVTGTPDVWSGTAANAAGGTGSTTLTVFAICLQ